MKTNSVVSNAGQTAPAVERQVALSSIQFDPTVQIRAEIDDEVVTDYAAAMEAGAKFPLVDIFAEGDRYHVGDGQHRLAAMKRNGDVNCRAMVHQGDRREAIRFALGANITHGLRRSNLDKHHAVEVGLREFAELSSVEIGRLCGVSHTFVDKVRAELQPATVAGSTEVRRDADQQPQLATVATPKAETRIGGDGKTRRLPRKKSHKPAVFDFDTWSTRIDATVASFLNGVPRNRREECVRFLQYSVAKFSPKPKSGTGRAARFAEVQAQVSDAKGNVEELRDELQNWLEGMPENLQQSQKAEDLQSAIDELETMIASLEEAEGVEVEFPGMYS